MDAAHDSTDTVVVTGNNDTGTSKSRIQKATFLSSKQQDKLKGWLNTVKKRTTRLSTQITASLGLISLTRDEEFERHYDNFKHLEKSIRNFIKNLTAFVDHFQNFLLALQNTSESLCDFYRGKSHHKELEELRKKNKALACEHFHAFRRTVDRQVIGVASQLLQKFSGPHQLVNKRSAKLLDYDNRTKEMESCRDPAKKNALRDQYVIAKELYDRINRQLIDELPLFNQFALEIFRQCILVLLESRGSLILSYTNQTAGLLDTPVYLALWPFSATGPNQLSISYNQQLKLIKGSDECGNPDWSLVQDRKGQLGYVPSSYIQKKE